MSGAYMPQTVSIEWETPQWLFDQLDSEFRFTVDGAATKENAKCPYHWTKEQDGLKQDWSGERIFINPPFGAKDLRAWSKKAWVASRLQGATVVMLVPTKTDQDWWHLYALQSEIRFIPGRITFQGATSCCPVPIAVLVFRHGVKPSARSLSRSASGDPLLFV